MDCDQFATNWPHNSVFTAKKVDYIYIITPLNGLKIPRGCIPAYMYVTSRYYISILSMGVVIDILYYI